MLIDAFGTVIHANPPWEQQRADCLRAVHASWQGAPHVPLAKFLRAYEEARAVQHRIVREHYKEFDFPERFALAIQACGAGEGAAREWGAIAAERYHRYQEALIDAYDEPGPALRALKDAGYKLALVSNYAHGAVLVDAFTRLGIREPFDAFIVSGDVGYLKPSPRIFDAACGALGVPKSDAVMVGDYAPIDVTGAKRAGVRAAVWAPYPRASPVPSYADADAVLGHLAELPGIVSKL